MANPSPPKPWERLGAGATGISSGFSAKPANTPALSSQNRSQPHTYSRTTTTSATAPTTSSTTSAVAPTNPLPPSLPNRPNTLSSVVNRTASNYSPYAANRYGSAYGTSPYGYGGYGNYNSPYPRLGANYGGMYGAGGYGGMYGGMGGMGGMGGYGGPYGGIGGMQPNPNDPASLTQSFSQSTAATFQLIESIIGAFSGMVQMLESTYMATQSSFFAMVSVAEQFGNLRTTLGSVLGLFTLIRWIRTLIAKITGKPPPSSPKELTPSKFASFTGSMPDGNTRASPSKKPFFLFIVAACGLPYIMGKLIRTLAQSQEEVEQRRRRLLEANGDPAAVAVSQPLDPSKLEFCRVLYDFKPDTTTGAVSGVDLMVNRGDPVAVLSKTDPLGNPSDWWLCRARDGRKGYLPAPYLEIISPRSQIGSADGANGGGIGGNNSRAQTLSNQSASSGEDGSRSASMVDRKEQVQQQQRPGLPSPATKVGSSNAETYPKD